jgi:hypothetical protein
MIQTFCIICGAVRATLYKPKLKSAERRSVKNISEGFRGNIWLWSLFMKEGTNKIYSFFWKLYKNCHFSLNYRTYGPTEPG